MLIIKEMPMGGKSHKNNFVLIPPSASILDDRGVNTGVRPPAKLLGGATLLGAPPPATSFALRGLGVRCPAGTTSGVMR